MHCHRINGCDIEVYASEFEYVQMLRSDADMIFIYDETIKQYTITNNVKDREIDGIVDMVIEIEQDKEDAKIANKVW